MQGEKLGEDGAFDVTAESVVTFTEVPRLALTAGQRSRLRQPLEDEIGRQMTSLITEAVGGFRGTRFRGALCCDHEAMFVQGGDVVIGVSTSVQVVFRVPADEIDDAAFDEIAVSLGVDEIVVAKVILEEALAKWAKPWFLRDRDVGPGA